MFPILINGTNFGRLEINDELRSYVTVNFAQSDLNRKVSSKANVTYVPAITCDIKDFSQTKQQMDLY